MRLKKKILVGYGIVFALMGLVVIWSIVNIVSLSKASSAILSKNYKSILAVKNMINALEKQQRCIILVHNAILRENYNSVLAEPNMINDLEKNRKSTSLINMEGSYKEINQFHENKNEFLKSFSIERDNITEKGEEEFVNSIEKDYSGYVLLFSKLISSISEAKSLFALSTSTFKDSLDIRFTRIRSTCTELSKLNEAAMYSSSNKASKVGYKAIWSTVFVTALVMIIALGFSLFLAEHIVRPIQRFMEASRRMSSGDLSVQVPIETNDELGHLAGEFNQMALKLKHFLEMNIEKIIAEKNKGDAILASIEDGLIVFDTELKVIGINPAACRIFNLEFADCISMKCSEILPIPSACELIKKAVETGVLPNLPEEKRIITLLQGENPLHYLFYITAIRGKEQSLSGIVLLFRDITRLKEVEQLKSEFVMAASHELRTPLTSLGLSIDLLVEDMTENIPERDKELLQTAHEEVERMKALVSDLLDLSKFETGKMDMEFSSVQLPTLIEHVEVIFKSQIEKKNVELITDLAKNIPNIRADANKLILVLTNLISNALRYIPQGGKIRVSAKKVRGYLHVSVQDNGPGIPPIYKTKVFQKFIQIEGRESGSTGLGLSICKEIINTHGGAIWVESDPGKGSTFTFTIPIAR